tara:strand:- start:6612 stop:7235 length:624 start_codon:yes stop_codon:yes gene_type:complete
MKINTILWDFDGVILDSMAVRDWGFREIFKDFSIEQVDQLITYHRANGGLSRFVKIKYFYEIILGETISENEILAYANSFSSLMRKELVNPENLIHETVEYIKKEYKNLRFHIVSGSAQDELRFLCKELGLAKYFHSIYGSPTPKKELVAKVLFENGYTKQECCLIGDSLNDYEAAEVNFINFFGFNNNLLIDYGMGYIDKFKDFKL